MEAIWFITLQIFCTTHIVWTSGNITLIFHSFSWPRLGNIQSCGTFRPTMYEWIYLLDLKWDFFIALEEDLFSKWARSHSLGTAIWSPWLHGSLNQLKFNFKSIKFFQARHTRSLSMQTPVSILKWALICLEIKLDIFIFSRYISSVIIVVKI